LKYKDNAERQVEDFELKLPPLASNVFWNSGWALNKLRNNQIRIFIDNYNQLKLNLNALT
jgi:hypothetical protein